MTALAAAVALAVVLPLAAATAGPEDAAGRGAPTPGSAAAASSADPSALPPSAEEPLPDGAGGASGAHAAPGEASAPEGVQPAGTTAVCGPPATGPEGVRTQTCVLSRDGDTWGRMYHSNPTGTELHGALSLLEPGGRTVQMPCTLPAGGPPGSCDTPPRPTERTGPGREPYLAVSEVGSPDGQGILLRSSSGTPSGA